MQAKTEQPAQMPVWKNNPSNQKDHWIPCSDDMPKKFGNYLITEMPIGDFEIEPYVATYYPEDAAWTTGSPIKIVRRPVIAWMPLPKPYKEKQNEKTI